MENRNSQPQSMNNSQTHGINSNSQPQGMNNSLTHGINSSLPQRGSNSSQPQGSGTLGASKPYESIFRKVVKWQDLHFYKKTEVLYQMTVDFCSRFFPKYGDRTVDQMIQAARSGKQNIVEGSEDGKTSTELELRLLNVARSSIGELRQDYEDFLKARKLKIWTPDDEQFQPMQDYTKQHNDLKDYEPHFPHWDEEEMANVGLTLCYQVDTMMNKYLQNLEKRFVTEGGIKERMHKARTDYRKGIDEHLAFLEKENAEQKQRIALLEQEKASLTEQLSKANEVALSWKQQYDNLRERALKSYYEKVEEIATLKKKIEDIKK